jgi:hypothetical protein
VAVFADDQLGVGDRVAVYDLGGGEFNATVLERTAEGFDVVGSPGGSEALGGGDFDESLCRFVGRQLSEDDWCGLNAQDTEPEWRRANYDFRRAVRRAKERLSDNPDATVFVPPPVGRDVTVSRLDLEGLIRADIENTIVELERTIHDAGMSAADLAAIYLAGGSSRIPLVTHLITKRLMSPKQWRDPKSVVALGAALAMRGRTAFQSTSIAPPAAASCATEMVRSPAPEKLGLLARITQRRRRGVRRDAVRGRGSIAPIQGIHAGAQTPDGEPAPSDSATDVAPQRNDLIWRDGEDPVECSVFAPPSVVRGDVCFVQVFVHLVEQAERAAALAVEFDADARRRAARVLDLPVRRGDRLTFELRAPGLGLDTAVESLIWRGAPASVQFQLRVPIGFAHTVAICTVIVSSDSVPLGHLKFKLETDRATVDGQRVGDAACNYRQAFVSYASRDRAEVLKRIQMLTPSHIGFFQDFLDLDPGQRWERELYRKIDECDLFFLFWSQHAKDSEWVRKEAEYARQLQGADGLSPPEFFPVILEGPPSPLPWPGFTDLHFDDRLLYLIATAERSI